MAKYCKLHDFSHSSLDIIFRLQGCTDRFAITLIEVN